MRTNNKADEADFRVVSSQLHVTSCRPRAEDAVIERHDLSAAYLVWQNM